MKNLKEGAQASAGVTSDKAVNEYLKRARLISAVKVAFSIVFLAAIGFGITGVLNRSAAPTGKSFSEVQNG